MIRSALTVTKPTPLAARGMVVAEHAIGAEVGAGILGRGGNAVAAFSPVPEVLSNMVDCGDSPQAAMEAPRVHTEGAELWVDDRAPAADIERLRRMGHAVVTKHESYGTFYFARPVAIRITKKGLEAGLDPLSAAAAAGV